MKIKIPPFLKKINYFKLLSWALLAIIILAILFLAIFINKNYFQVKKSIKDIIKLSEEVTPVMVDIKTYNKILENIENKQQLKSLNLTDVKNPFLTTTDN
jgi:uncharacterized membrane protein YcgQ (UPF0703/DUF1980 family)